jgi:hypothetical protein
MLRRSLLGLVVVVVVAAAVVAIVRGAKSTTTTTSSTSTTSPTSGLFPATVAGQRWTGGQLAVQGQLKFDSAVVTGGNHGSLCENVADSGAEWTVWCTNSSQYPVISVDGGHHWTVAGPDLSSDWAGGSLFSANSVTACSANEAAMTGFMVDLTVDGGHTWFQFFPSAAGAGADSVTVLGCAGGSGTGAYQLMIRETLIPNSGHGGSSATYVTRNSGRTWIRTSEHVV